MMLLTGAILILFLSTLSLRRATEPIGTFRTVSVNFYPRSPCGERLSYYQDKFYIPFISIHALLAESDWLFLLPFCTRQQFLSTLSLRRATRKVFVALIPDKYFYPRSPCGERLNGISLIIHIGGFLSTLSLRRATNKPTQRAG